MNSNNVILIVAIVAVLGAGAFLLYTDMNRTIITIPTTHPTVTVGPVPMPTAKPTPTTTKTVENFEDAVAPEPEAPAAPTGVMGGDVLSAQDLLPQCADSPYAQVVPNGQGSINDGNLLNSGYHLGVNTVGSSLRNANRQLRSEPPNPQVKVSPWNQTTIEPDMNQRELEIGN